jgi:hypothetical protein
VCIYYNAYASSKLQSLTFCMCCVSLKNCKSLSQFKPCVHKGQCCKPTSAVLAKCLEAISEAFIIDRTELDSAGQTMPKRGQTTWYFSSFASFRSLTMNVHRRCSSAHISYTVTCTSRPLFCNSFFRHGPPSFLCFYQKQQTPTGDVMVWAHQAAAIGATAATTSRSVRAALP